MYVYRMSEVSRRTYIVIVHDNYKISAYILLSYVPTVPTYPPPDRP